MSLTVGSLFSGIGGLELGLERAGMRVVWQVESDGYAQKVLAKHWPDVHRFDDVRTAHGEQARLLQPGDKSRCNGCLKPVDLICGGFPCQDISVAGKGKGLAGERSGLWREFYRLIRELRPRYVLVENVSALLARGMDRVLGDLAEVGMDAEWQSIPACALGVPQRRERVFIVAYARRGGVESSRKPGVVPGAREEEREGERLFGALPDIGGSREDVANTEGERRCARRTESNAGRKTGPLGAGVTDIRQAWEPEPNVGRVADGVPSRVDRLRCLGNAVVPQVAEFIGRRILAREAA